MAQIASSFQTPAVMEVDTPKLRKAKRSAMNPKREINKPTHVNGEVFERIGFFETAQTVFGTRRFRAQCGPLEGKRIGKM